MGATLALNGLFTLTKSFKSVLLAHINSMRYKANKLSTIANTVGLSPTFAKPLNASAKSIGLAVAKGPPPPNIVRWFVSQTVCVSLVSSPGCDKNIQQDT